MPGLILRHKTFIIIMTVVIMLVAFTFDFLLRYNKMVITLTLNYEGTERGLYPNGTRFNIFEIVSDEVLSETLNNLNMPDMTIEKLRDRIDFYARSMGYGASYVKKEIVNGKDFSYVPNEFTISYSQKNKISKNMTRDVLKALTEAYREYFIRNYTENPAVLENGKVDPGKYEYVEIAELYSDRINSLSNYLRNHLMENPTFRSESTGLTFEDLIVMLENMQNIDVDKYRAFIVTSGITRNKAVFLEKLNYRQNALGFDYLRALNSKNAYVSAIGEYDPRVTDIVFVPTRDATREFYMNRTKIGLDYLVDYAYAYGVAVQNIQKDIDRNNLWIRSFSGAEAQVSPTTLDTATLMLNELEAKLDRIINLTTDTANDYIRYKTRDYLKFTIPEYSFSDFISIKRILYNAVFGFFTAVFLVLAREYYNKRRVITWR